MERCLDIGYTKREDRSVTIDLTLSLHGLLSSGTQSETTGLCLYLCMAAPGLTIVARFFLGRCWGPLQCDRQTCVIICKTYCKFQKPKLFTQRQNEVSPRAQAARDSWSAWGQVCRPKRGQAAVISRVPVLCRGALMLFPLTTCGEVTANPETALLVEKSTLAMNEEEVQPAASVHHLSVQRVKLEVLIEQSLLHHRRVVIVVVGKTHGDGGNSG